MRTHLVILFAVCTLTSITAPMAEAQTQHPAQPVLKQFVHGIGISSKFCFHYGILKPVALGADVVERVTANVATGAAKVDSAVDKLEDQTGPSKSNAQSAKAKKSSNCK